MQMTEASLQLEVFRHWPHRLWTEAVVVRALLVVPLPDRIEPAFDDEPTEIDRPRRLVHETLLARRVDHQERGAFEVQPLADLVHEIDRIPDARRRDVTVGMTCRHHPR